MIATRCTLFSGDRLSFDLGHISDLVLEDLLVCVPLVGTEDLLRLLDGLAERLTPTGFLGLYAPMVFLAQAFVSCFLVVRQHRPELLLVIALHPFRFRRAG